MLRAPGKIFNEIHLTGCCSADSTLRHALEASYVTVTETALKQRWLQISITGKSDFFMQQNMLNSLFKFQDNNKENSLKYQKSTCKESTSNQKGTPKKWPRTPTLNNQMFKSSIYADTIQESYQR